MISHPGQCIILNNAPTITTDAPNPERYLTNNLYFLEAKKPPLPLITFDFKLNYRLTLIT
jgi:hypothetical protein